MLIQAIIHLHPPPKNHHRKDTLVSSIRHPSSGPLPLRRSQLRRSSNSSPPGSHTARAPPARQHCKKDLRGCYQPAVSGASAMDRHSRLSDEAKYWCGKEANTDEGLHGCCLSDSRLAATSTGHAVLLPLCSPPSCQPCLLPRPDWRLTAAADATLAGCGGLWPSFLPFPFIQQQWPWPSWPATQRCFLAAALGGPQK